MATPNYSYEKRQRELAKKRKQEEKRQKKQQPQREGRKPEQKKEGGPDQKQRQPQPQEQQREKQRHQPQREQVQRTVARHAIVDRRELAAEASLHAVLQQIAGDQEGERRAVGRDQERRGVVIVGERAQRVEG